MLLLPGCCINETSLIEEDSLVFRCVKRTVKRVQKTPAPSRGRFEGGRVSSKRRMSLQKENEGVLRRRLTTCTRRSSGFDLEETVLQEDLRGTYSDEFE